MKVRMMLPMTVRCTTCGEFMYKGTKFNCKKEDVVGEKYLGLQIFRFYMHCRKCSAEITYITDPQNLDYKVEHGASRNFEVWKQEQTVEEALKAKRAAEDEDKLKRIENKTADAKKEMDVHEFLDNMMHAKGQHSTISADEAIAALRNRAAEEARASGGGDITEADEEALQLMISAGKFTRRIDDEEEAKARPPDIAPRRMAPAVKKKWPAVVAQPAVKRKLESGNGAAGPPASATKKGAADQNPAPGSDAGEGGAAVAKKAQPAAVGLGLGNYSSSSGSDSGE